MQVVHFQRTPDESFDIDTARAAADAAGAVGDARGEAANLVRWATGLQYADRHDEALAAFESVLARSHEPGFREYAHFAQQHMGKCLVEMGRTREAMAAFHRALAERVLLDDVGLVASSRRALDAASGLSMVRVGVGAVVVRAGRILMARRRGVHGSGTWSTPGGHLDFGESPETCAIREVLEETGVEVARPELLTVTNDILEQDGRHYVTLWMRCAHVGGDGEPLATWELDAVDWFTPDELPEPLFQPFAAMLRSGIELGGS